MFSVHQKLMLRITWFCWIFTQRILSSVLILIAFRELPIIILAGYGHINKFSNDLLLKEVSSKKRENSVKNCRFFVQQFCTPITRNFNANVPSAIQPEIFHASCILFRRILRSGIGYWYLYRTFGPSRYVAFNIAKVTGVAVPVKSSRPGLLKL